METPISENIQPTAFFKQTENNSLCQHHCRGRQNICQLEPGEIKTENVCLCEQKSVCLQKNAAWDKLKPWVKIIMKYERGNS